MKATEKESIDVLVFETNIQTKADLIQVTPAIQSELRIKKWNVDQDDISNVLRVETNAA